ncbi:MAG: hypothetical protein LBC02_12420 [Planctomycetaceae bacterium]|nr:hypothetical protein [Planctomycetaceae bacterium]
MVVNLSPKGWSVIADSAPVFGWQLSLPPGFLSDFRPNTGSLSAIADQCFGETSATHRLNTYK